MTQVRLEPAAPRSRVKHSTTESLRSIHKLVTHFLNALSETNLDALIRIALAETKAGCTIVLYLDNFCLNSLLIFFKSTSESIFFRE